MTDKDE